MFGFLEKVDKEIYEIFKKELKRQRETLNLIASENATSYAIMAANGFIFTNKYAEGYPGARYYGGCIYVDEAEKLAIERARKLFKAEHANVQPHSGTQANMAVYFAFLKPGDTILSLELPHGGHLSHGAKVSFSGKLYNVVHYGVHPETELIDYKQVEELALKYRPKIIVTGASAYSRVIDFKKFREIADKVGAYLMVDIAHFAGLVAGEVYPSPVPYADFVTATTHKTLRGPRGGFILCKKEYAKKIDKSVFPGIQGGPLMHLISAKAVAFKEASTPEFKEYVKQVVKNAKKLAEEMAKRNYRIVSGGTDSHLFLVDLRQKGITGKEAEEVLEKVNIVVNKNTIPFDPQPPKITSGIRIGTPTITTRGMKEKEMEIIAEFIDEALKNKDNETKLKEIKEKVKKFLSKFPLYKEFDL